MDETGAGGGKERKNKGEKEESKTKGEEEESRGERRERRRSSRRERYYNEYTRTWDNEIEVVFMGRETEEGKAKEIKKL